MDGIYTIDRMEQYAGGEIFKSTTLHFEMSQNDWLISKKSKEFRDFVEHIRFCTAYRDKPEMEFENMYSVAEFTECECLHSVIVSFSLTSHDWLKLKGSKVFLGLVSYLWELETRDSRRENRFPQDLSE